MEHLHLKYLTLIQLEFDLRLVKIVNFYELTLLSQSPLTEHKVLMELQLTEGHFSVIYILNDIFITTQNFESKCHNLIATIHQFKHCGGLCMVAVLYVHLCSLIYHFDFDSQYTVCQWNIAVNKPSGRRPSTGS